MPIFLPSAPRTLCAGSAGSYTITPMSQSSPRALMRKMSSVWRKGRSGFARTASERAMISSRDTLSGGCQALNFGAMFILLLRQHETGVGFGTHRDRAAGRQVGLAVEQALQLDLAAA